jgi:hypothetical protein
MFVMPEQLLMFILGDGREWGTPRTVAGLNACDSFPTAMRDHRPATVRPVAGFLCEVKP